MFPLSILIISQPDQRKLRPAYAGSWVAQARESLPVLDPKCGRPEMVQFLKLIKNEEGATAIEYGLIAALIAVAAIGAMQGIGNKLNTTFNNVSNSLG